jgi:cholest-4-en-3-one 26-monooxygenase
MDLLDGAFWAGDPIGNLAWLRENDPVHHDDTNDVWGITRHADIMRIEREPELFSNAQGIRPHSYPLPMMISMDPPLHTKRRKLVNRGFTPRRIRDLEPKVREACDAIIDRLDGRTSCDFVWDVAAVLPIVMIADLLGFPEEDRETLLEWSDDLMRATTSTDTEAMEAGHQAMLKYEAWCREVIADRRARAPEPNLMSTLVHAEVDGDTLTDDDVLYESLLLLIGGDETTRHVISGGMLELLRNPDQRDELAADLSLLPRAVEEMLRWVSPIKNMSRTVQREVEIGGKQLRPGDQLLLLYPSANRDREVFEDPDRFDIHRHPNPHIAFGGHGPHHCLGASLARLELTVMFERVLARLPDLELAGDDLPVRPANFVSGFEAMPVRFGVVA